MSSAEEHAATDAEDVTRELLAGWGLPDPGDDKKARGDVLVVGGSRRTPGGVMLAGEAALRVGAGRLAMIVPQSIDAHLGAVLPEAAIYALPDDAAEPFPSADRDRIAGADAVLVGPGFDDIGETLATLRAVLAARPARVVLDAYALGALPRVPRDELPGTLVLTPNREELGILLGGDSGAPAEVDDLDVATRAAAERYNAVVSCFGTIADPEGRIRHVRIGGPGLATSGSGDVLAGATVGFAARGIDPARAAAWATWVHAHAGDRLAERLGLGFLARELAAELPLAVREVS